MGDWVHDGDEINRILLKGTAADGTTIISQTPSSVSEAKRYLSGGKR